MLDLAKIEAVVTKELQDIVLDLQANMVSTGANASGRTSQSLKVESNLTATRVVSQITGGTGWAFVEQGRGRTQRTGNGQLKGIIRQWIIDKGITPEQGMTIDSLAFVITRAIHRRGTLLHLLGERREIYSNVVTTERIDRITERIGDEIALQVSSDIINMFKR